MASAVSALTPALARTARGLAVLLVVSVFTFLLTVLAPGDPAEEILRRGGTQPTPGSVARLRAELGLDAPLPVRYLRWLGDVLRGDLGDSYADRAPVAAEIVSRVPATLWLAALASVIAVTLAVVVAVRTVLRPHALDGRIALTLIVAAGAVPPYIVGVLLISVVAVGLGTLPTGGAGSPVAVVLPAFTLGLAGAATLLRLLRADLVSATRQPFVVLARAKGVSTARVVAVHALRAAAPAAIATASVVAAELLAGAVVVETLFSWPGLGQYAVSAIRQRDLPVVQAYVLLTAAGTALLLTLADVCAAWADPRIRGSGT
ncbi:ABC transporter permease [Microtetraspora sp. NBRC 13810]|uniref:ABC transporter permease n=1 Tax=Microtetraspora sp. NBRC 13810 TaxID=3030990 RepID=UPI002556A46A|nr:ABC transporter permease [Microtetraspora sp. NBRC 13810]